MIQINKLAMFSLMSDCNMRIWILYGLYFYGNYLYCILLFKSSKIKNISRTIDDKKVLRVTL
jgi:hypothetical protein